MIRKVLEELLSINQDHEYSYSREELIELMDDQWAYLKGKKTYED